MSPAQDDSETLEVPAASHGPFADASEDQTAIYASLPETAAGEELRSAPRPVTPESHEDDTGAGLGAPVRPAVPPAPTTSGEVTFPTAWRGYEPGAVDAYLREVAATVVDLRATQTPQDVVQRALARVGEDTAAILREAEQAAERMTVTSRNEASERVERAEREADEITRRARRRVSELDTDIDRIWVERQRLIDDTRTLAQALVRIATQAEERFPAEEEQDARAAPSPPSALLLDTGATEEQDSPLDIAAGAEARHPPRPPGPDPRRDLS